MSKKKVNFNIFEFNLGLNAYMSRFKELVDPNLRKKYYRTYHNRQYINFYINFLKH